MESEFERATAELAEAYEFSLALPKLPAEQMVERAKARDPSFIKHIEEMEDPPKDSFEFWTAFTTWTITSLMAKYYDIWEKVSDTYFRSDASQRVLDKLNQTDAVKSQIDKILKDSGFGEEQ